MQTITIENVADFGNGVLQQFVVFQSDQKNWINGSVTVDVKPNMVTSASANFVISNGTSFTSNVYGVNFPSWQRDGQSVGFTFAGVTGRQIAANPLPGQSSAPLFPDGAIRGRRHELSPVGEEVLVYDWPYIGLGTVGDSASVLRILELSGTLFGMDWLRDGSGLVGGEELGLGNTHANIWRYTLSNAEVFNLTNFDDENRGYAADPGISPDGTEIVFIYAPTSDADAEIHIMDINGGNERFLGVYGLYPDWGIPGELTNPTVTPTVTPTATKAGGQSTPAVTPSPTATSAPGSTATPTTVANGLPRQVYLPVVQR